MVRDASTPVRVLAIVDDDPDVRLVVRVMLERIGADVELEFSSGEDAIDAIDAGANGVVILDHQLAGSLTGLAAAPLLKQRVPGARIILCSTIDLSAEARREPAITSFVCKLQIVELVDAVRRAAATFD